MRYTRSVLKWPGGKYALLSRIAEALPSSSVLVEPFVGAGVVSLNMDADAYVLNDTNGDLMDLYHCLKTYGSEFVTYAKQWFTPQGNVSHRYLACREAFNASRGDPKALQKRAALFLYLNRHGYNGLCRYNQAGGYNVPFGRYKRPYFPELEMQRMITKLQKASLHALDFRALREHVPQGATVYADPPYVPWNNKGFTSYAPNRFHGCDHEDLVALASHWSSIGSTVVISNHDTPQTRALYHTAEVTSFPVRRTIGCVARTRGLVQELLAVFRASHDIMNP